MFITKDNDIEHLKNLVAMYEDKRFEGMRCDWADCCNCGTFDVLDVVRAIGEHHREDDGTQTTWHNKAGFFSDLQEHLDEEYKTLEYYNEIIRKESPTEQAWSKKWHRESRNKASEICATLERAISNGFKYVFILDFGNDGEVAGYLGDAVRSEAKRDISVNDKLVVINEDWS
jgi:hypothetical protein